MTEQASSNASSRDDIPDIEDIHRHAILQKESTYTDPSTGFMVFTELAHLKRGKCCGNTCRHCPYGWSNVKNELGELRSTPDASARAISGDREGAGKLVKRILDGTYYDEDDTECCSVDQCQQSTKDRVSSTDRSTVHVTKDSETTVAKEVDTIKDAQTSKETKGQGKGGCAGGTLTSKNVPYTRKGDSGTSQLFTGERRKKDDDLFEALGTVDELCCVVGVVYAELKNDDDKGGKDAVYGDLPQQLLDVMSRLFDVGSHIATPTHKTDGSKSSSGRVNAFYPHHTPLLEEWIDSMTEQLPELTSFILPTGSPASAQLHVARTVCRRAERRMVPLVEEDGSGVDHAALAYVNRLSDFFFTAGRFVNYCEDRDEVQYRREDRGLIGKNSSGKASGSRQRERVVVKLR